jgi:hypothetical protein
MNAVNHLKDFWSSMLDGVRAKAKDKPTPMHQTQIKVIKPYMWEGIWVFDDPAVGLYKEALVAGMPEMILKGCQLLGINNPENGFVAVFSKDPFPDAKIVLEWVREEMGGNVYTAPALGGIEGWLCPALFKYFDKAPQTMYIDLKPSPQ